jgi:hypothetical protein
MYSRKFGIHGLISAAVAFAILGASVFILDRGYPVSAPVGIVEVAALTPIQQLDEITVTAAP